MLFIGWVCNVVCKKLGSFGAKFIKSCSSFRLRLVQDSFVRDYGPIFLSLTREAPGGLEIWLIKAWEDIVAEISLKLSVEVLLAVNFVHK